MAVASSRGGEGAGSGAVPGTVRPAILVPAPFVPASSLRRGPGSPREPLFPATPELFPWLERRFRAGERTTLGGPAALVGGFLPFLLAAVAANGGTVSVREGANRFAPYAIGALARRWGRPASEVLGHLRVARAFTVHQMVTLAERWGDEEAVASPPADLLVASDPFLLFQDPEVEAYEREALIPHLEAVLGRLPRAMKRPLLLVRYGPDRGPVPGEGPGEDPAAGETLRLEPRPDGGLRLRAERARATLELVALAPRQRYLEEFDDGGAIGGGIQRWGALSPPTA